MATKASRIRCKKSENTTALFASYRPKIPATSKAQTDNYWYYFNSIQTSRRSQLRIDAAAS